MGNKIIWDEEGKHFYENGVDHAILYVKNSGTYGAGVPWNGVTKVSEKPSGADASELYADGIKYLELRSAEKFGASIEAYTYPDEFGICDGSAELAEGVTVGQQPRSAFGLCYRTKVGNDETEDLGYKYHLIYGAKASPSSKDYNTVNDNPEAITFSWELTTTPVEIKGYKKAAHLEIDSTKVTDKAKLGKFLAIVEGADDFSETATYEIGDIVTHESALYQCKTAVTTPGSWSASSWETVSVTAGPRLPLPDEVKNLFA